MRTALAFCAVLALVACNGGGDDTINHLADAPGHGSGSGGDGGHGSGSGSDGPPAGDTSCGAAIPTSAPAVVTLSGTISDDDPTYGTNAAGLQGAQVDAFRNGNGASTGTNTTGAGGVYMIDIETGLPTDYLTMSEAGYTPARYYPKAPAASTKTFGKVPLLTTASTAALPGSLGATQSAGKGMIVVTVADCASTRLAGATVSVTPAGGSTVKYLGGGAATNSGGVAVIFNVDPGTATVSAAAAGLDMRSVTVEASPSYTTTVIVSEH